LTYAFPDLLMDANETIYYWDGVVLISDQRLLFGSYICRPETVDGVKVFLLNARATKPFRPFTGLKRTLGLVLFALVALLVIVIIAVNVSNSFGVMFGTFIFVLIFHFRTRYAKVKSLSVIPPPVVYALQVLRSNGSFTALVSLDEAYVGTIAKCLSEKVVGRTTTRSNYQASRAVTETRFSQGSMTGPGSDSIYYDGIVDVSCGRIRLGPNSYSTIEIEGVGIDTVSSDRIDRLSSAWIALLLLCSSGFSLAKITSQPYSGLGTTLGAITGVCSLAVLAWLVFLGTERGESAYLLNVQRQGKKESALASLDKEYIEKVIEAVQKAQKSISPTTGVARLERQ
jgi:hypothetical protein